MKPILFNGDMVKAILEGRKTQTRRIIKSIGNAWHYGKLLGDWGLSSKPDIKDSVLFWELQTDVDDSKIFNYKLPYQVGDILWVRETWCLLGSEYWYKADELPIGCRQEPKWHPSIHMPRTAARIFLKVTDVRVERLTDITEDGAFEEGITLESVLEIPGSMTAKILFECLWDSIYKNWNDNPWVWVIEFEKVAQ